MKPFSIFRPGQHTSAGGQTLSFSDEDARATVEAYDPNLHEAPIVVGHPKHNLPAYGWVKTLSFADDGNIKVDSHQVDADFAEMVEAGRFKKRSASFYQPDSPNNPVPGVYYLRHVGFLGAQPPAVKGLRDIEFDETEEGVVEFTDPYIVASLFRRMREFIVDKFSVEEADRVVPDYLVQDLEAAARAPAEPEAAFTEDGDQTMTPEEIQALQAENEQLKAKNAELETSAASFTEQQTDIAAREAAVRRAELGAEVDKFIAEGRVLPAQKAALVEFMSALDTETQIEFGEGDTAEKLSQRQFMEKFLSELPKAVEFSEVGGGESGSDDLNPEDVAKRAVEFQESEKAKGRAISTSEAVAAVREGKDK